MNFTRLPTIIGEAIENKRGFAFAKIFEKLPAEEVIYFNCLCLKNRPFEIIEYLRSSFRSISAEEVAKNLEGGP